MRSMLSKMSKISSAGEVSLSNEREKALQDAARYLESYLSLEVQSIDDAATDPQLATITLPLIERIDGEMAGNVVDIGCGQGVLLSKLSESDAFRQKDWVYIGIGDRVDLDKIADFARFKKINRKIELIELDEFYSQGCEVEGSKTAVVRNVFHELNISQTASLICMLCRSSEQFDEVIIQDLMRFPKGERSNACWDPLVLKGLLEKCGFNVIGPLVHATRSGNAFFNMIARPSTLDLETGEVEHLVALARHEQWESWVALESGEGIGHPKRGEIIEALDLDLQLAALTAFIH